MLEDQSEFLQRLAAEVADLKETVAAQQSALLEAQITPQAVTGRVGATDIPEQTAGVGAYAPTTVLGDGVVTSASIAPGAVGSTAFASGIVPPRVVTSLPTLPDAAYPAGSIIFLTTDTSLYKTITGLVGSWTKMVDAADIVSNSITAGQIAVGAIGADEIAAGAVTTSKLDLRDEYGATILTSQGFGDPWTRFIQTGLYNADFRLPNETPADPIGTGNEVPYWTSYKVGTVVTAKSVTSSATASGRVIEFTVATGGAEWDRLTLNQVIPCVPSRGRGTLYDVSLVIHTPSSVDDTVGAGVYGTWLDKDLVQIGDKVGGAYPLSTIGASKDYEMAWLFGPPPATAQYLNVEPSVYRRSTGSTAAVVEISDLRVRMSDTNLHIPDDAYSSSYGPGRIRATSGYLDIDANDGKPTGTSPYIRLDGRTEAYGNAIYLFYDGSDWISFGAAGDIYKNDTSQVRLTGDLLATDGILVTKVRTDAGFSDTDFAGATAYNGGIGINSNTGRIYFRYGGNWHYCTQDGGFSVPAYEATCPACGEPLLPDDALVGKGDRFEADGALHGLWVHLRCADRPLDRELADAYHDIASASREDKEGRKIKARALRLVRSLRRSPPAQAVRHTAD